MAKTVIETPRPTIASPYFSGYIDEMPQAAKDKMKAEKPEAYKQIFGEEEIINT